MRAIRIDPILHEVAEITLPDPEGERLTAMQQAVGGWLELVRLDPPVRGHDLYVDEEGLLKAPEFFFVIEGGHQPYAGCGLVVGHRGEATTPATVSTDEVSRRVRFLRRVGPLMIEEV